MQVLSGQDMIKTWVCQILEACTVSHYANWPLKQRATLWGQLFLCLLNFPPSPQQRTPYFERNFFLPNCTCSFIIIIIFTFIFQITMLDIIALWLALFLKLLKNVWSNFCNKRKARRTERDSMSRKDLAQHHTLVLI